MIDVRKYDGVLSSASVAADLCGATEEQIARWIASKRVREMTVANKRVVWVEDVAKLVNELERKWTARLDDETEESGTVRPVKSLEKLSRKLETKFNR